MCMTVLEGNYTLRETVTSEGVRLSLKTLQGAARSLDDGYYTSRMLWTTWTGVRSTRRRMEGEVAYESLSVMSSYTVAMSFITNTLAEVETEERFRRYQQSSMEELSSPEFWQFVHHDQESDSSEEWGTT